MERVITSAQNPIIQHIKSLRIKKGRDKLGQFVIEGYRIIKDAFENNVKIEFIVLDETNANKNISDFIGVLLENEIKIYTISQKLVNEISDTDNSQGIFAIVSKKESSFDDILSIENGFLVMLDNLQDPGNMGTIIRTADASGAHGIIISKGCVDVFNPKVLRSTMGSIFHIPIIKVDYIDNAISQLSSQGYSVYAAHPYGKNLCYEVSMTSKTAIIIGNEGNGLSENVLKSCHQIKIPMLGRAESLNASISAVMMMYECLRQRMSKSL